MAYDLAPLMSYVRFYLTVVAQLRRACEQVERSHKVASEAVAPFAEPLAPVKSQALQAAVGTPHTFGAALADLWSPEDPEGLFFTRNAHLSARGHQTTAEALLPVVGR